MEALRLQKKLVVVINTRLMDNHQTELANAMAKRKHLFVVENPEALSSTEVWDQFHAFSCVPHSGGDPMEFPRLLDEMLGFTQKV
jgi:beta-1,4-N-acetylglucosaminyltransferase